MILAMRSPVRAAFLAVLLMAGISACGGEAKQSSGGESADFAYKVLISGERESVEWVAPGHGWWRETGRDAAGCRYELARAEDRYLTQVSCYPPVVRIGSPAFLALPGDIGAEPIRLDVLRGRREISVGDEFYVERGDRRLVLTIAERIPLAEARARGLFDISTEGAVLRRPAPAAVASRILTPSHWSSHLRKRHHAEIQRHP